MYHFFVDRSQVTENKIYITGSDVNHIRTVLRMGKGEDLAISDGSNKLYHCRIIAVKEEEIVTAILSVKENFVELPAEIYLFQGLPKADKMEWIIQKAVELGAAAIVPMATNRAIVKLDEKREQSKQKRWKAIAESAAKQSGRGVIPEIFPMMSLKEAYAFVKEKEFETKLIPYECAEGMEHTRELIGKIKSGSRIAIFIGPEGGFEKEEIAAAIEAGIEPITLGKRILRTETAGMAVLAVLMFYLDGMAD